MGSTLLVLLIVAAVVIVALIIILLRQGATTPSTPPAPAPIIEDEATEVRVVGHRLVRMAGGVRIGNDFPLIGRVVIGRDKGCNLHLADPVMSGVHCEISVEGGKAYLTDRESTNGTMINGEALASGARQALEDGDLIHMGTTTLMYKNRS